MAEHKTDTKLHSKRDMSHQRQFAGQHDGEKVVAVVRQFFVALRKPLLVGMIIIVVGMLPWAIANNYAYGLVPVMATFMWISFGVLAVYWLWHWVGWYYSVFILTSSRLMVIKQKGFFNRSVSELALNNIQSVNYHINGFNAALFGFGDIQVQTLSGSGAFDLRIIHHPAVFQQQILDAVHHHGSTPSEPS